MASGKRLLFVTVAGNSVGFGHLNRCLSIAAHATHAGASVSFLVFGGEEAQTRLASAGYPTRLCPMAALAEAAEEPFRDLADAVLADLVHPTFMDGHPQAVFARLRQIGRVLVALDALGELSLAGMTPDLPIDILVVPYVASDIDRARIARCGRRQLAGAEYALLSPDYADLPPREVRAHADRILVTCGGSDPNRWTLAVLHGLEAIEVPLELRVVVGPMFDPILRRDIEALAARSAHRVALVNAPPSLLAHMQWCDLAIATSGLTKYELAATATPVLMFSIDALHDATNRAFSTIGSAVDFGVGITAEQIAGEARSLLADQERRAAMAAAGRAMVDGRGTQRLIAEVMKDVDAA